MRKKDDGSHGQTGVDYSPQWYTNGQRSNNDGPRRTIGYENAIIGGTLGGAVLGLLKDGFIDGTLYSRTGQDLTLTPEGLLWVGIGAVVGAFVGYIVARSTRG